MIGKPMKGSRELHEFLKAHTGTAMGWMAAGHAAPVFCLVLALLAAFGVGFGQDPASTFHHDAQRTGRESAIGPIAPRLIWSYRTQASIDASPVISREGTIYLASTDNGLYALTPSGQLKWKFTARESIFSTPTLAPDGSILFADLAGWYYAVKPDGSLKWSRALSGGSVERRAVASPAVAANGQSYIGAWNDQFYSLDSEGTLLWQIPIGGDGQITASPALDSAGNVYLAAHDSSDKNRIAVFKFEPGSTLVWKFTDDLGVDRNRIISSPAVDTSSGLLYIGASRSEDGCLYGLSLTDGSQVFKAILPRGIVSSPAIAAGGTVYVGCLDGKIYALDGSTGESRWSFSSGAYFVLGSPSIDGFGRIFFGDSDGVIHALTPWGTEIWSYAAQSNISSAPAIAQDGTLYVTSYDSTLYAIAQLPRSRGREFR
jgi:outer membrane protein assembly factor BamB